MAAGQGGRVAIEPGFFTIPRERDEPPRLLGSRCRACGEHFFPRREICAKCLHHGTDEALLGPRGRLYTWTYVHFPLFGSKRADVGGYGVGQVDLPEGSGLTPGTVLHTFGYPEPEIFGFLYVIPAAWHRWAYSCLPGWTALRATATATCSTG